MKPFTFCSIISTIDNTILVNDAVFFCNKCMSFFEADRHACGFIIGIFKEDISKLYSVRYGLNYCFTLYDKIGSKQYRGLRIGNSGSQLFYIKKKSKRGPWFRRFIKSFGSTDNIAEFFLKNPQNGRCRCSMLEKMYGK